MLYFIVLYDIYKYGNKVEKKSYYMFDVYICIVLKVYV